ncbi:DUF4190 domain-containing protein [Neolewinella persica]|uniref:DUF4190 domain-containing protein n=1 Tax=Neolewinella persica TaxID=70998 RepID=UPI00036EF6D8|nr:DUF4190 domain-containing protein [Neolewinella persica]
MKFLLLLFCSFILSVGQLEAALGPLPVAVESETVHSGKVTPDRAGMEARLGRKLRFSERIARKQQKQAQKNGVTDGLGVASFIVGLGSIMLLTAGGLGFLTAIAGLVIGIVSLGRINRNPEFRTGKGFAIAGIAINGGLIFLTLLAYAIIISAFN